MLQSSKGECMSLAAYAGGAERLAERYNLPVFSDERRRAKNYKPDFSYKAAASSSTSECRRAERRKP